ncbi:hypothetical protein [Roseobacter weihaiensis]|uniref:hypothetical protein n=1 Tax=Roseobacter weihaiensis TaxID=2763262 RepID=UPI001D0A4824|nr:hypothetical protein [Roseobacter sp. H9]
MTYQFKHPTWPGVSEPVEGADLRVLSLGAGVQSTTLALMAAHGEIGPMPDAAIFADTGWEPEDVYEHLAWLGSGNVLPFPIYRVQAVDLRSQVQGRAEGVEGRFVSIPYFLDHGGMNRRQCTREAKIDPIRREVRRLLGVAKGARATGFSVEQWIGISTDETERMKDARESWITHRWPLIEARMSRGDCLAWCRRHGYPEPPKSACIGCPFRNNARWLDMTRNDPAAFQDAVALDAAMRRNGPANGMRGLEYMHRSCRPLGEIDFEIESGGADFLDECDGVCGT